MAQAELSDVLSARVITPDGLLLIALSGTIPRRAGVDPDTVSIDVLATSRLKKVLEFDGSFTAVKAEGFTRTVLPLPGGSSLKSSNWNIFVTPPGEGGEFQVGPLILTEAEILRGSIAEGALGKFTPDLGGERLETWRLALADTRILWREMGFIAGKRNFRSLVGPTVRAIDIKQRTIKVTPPNVKFDQQQKRIVAEEGEEVSIQLQAIRDGFDGSSVPSEGGLFSARELIQQVLDRLPLTFNLGPGEVLASLDEIFPLDIDWKTGISAATALEEIAEKSGLVIGLELDGSVFVDFDAVPSAAAFSKSGVIGQQFRWVREERAGRVKPRASKVRFYPSRVIQEVVTADFDPVAKDFTGQLVPLEQFATKAGFGAAPADPAVGIGITFGDGAPGGGVDAPVPGGAGIGGTPGITVTFGRAVRAVRAARPRRALVVGQTPAGSGGGGSTTGHLAYIAAVKDEVERPAVRDVLEQKFTSTVAVGDTQNLFRILLDAVHRLFRYSPRDPAGVAEIANSARTTARAELEADSKPPFDLPEGGKAVIGAPVKTKGYNFLAQLDQLLATPLKVVTKVDLVGELRPRFLTDIPLHRTYDFIAEGLAISEGSYVNPPPGAKGDTGFRENFYENLAKATLYFGQNPGDFSALDPPD